MSIFDFAACSCEGVSQALNRLSLSYSLRKGRIGRSVLGSPIFSACLGCGERRLLVVAGQHANEWIGTQTVMAFIAGLCSGCVCGLSSTELLTRCTIYIVPLLNPDGAALAQGRLCRGQAFDNARLISGDFPAIPFPRGWKANISGVDLNLQFPAGWDRARDIKFSAGFDRPAPRDFVGTHPLSEPESAALARFTREIDPDLAITLHSQGEVIYYSFRGCAPADGRALGEKMSSVSGYSLELTPPESDNAGFKDWFIHEFNKPAYTIELGLGENPLPECQLRQIYPKAAAMLTQAMLWKS